MTMNTTDPQRGQDLAGTNPLERPPLTPSPDQRDIRPRAGERVEVKPRDKRMAWWFLAVVAVLLVAVAIAVRS